MRKILLLKSNNHIQRFKIFSLLLITLVLYSNCQQQSSCLKHCLDCQPGIELCYACADNYESDIFGGCHEDSIQNCNMYGMDSVCAKCKPTFMLHDGKCSKLFNGCLHQNGQSAQQCWQCGFGMKLDATKSKCTGTLNCAAYKDQQQNSPCIKCAEGYELQNKDNKQICVDNSVGCAEKIAQSGVCIKCKNNYFISGYQCVQQKYKNPLCYIANTKGHCTYCKEGLNIYQGKCLTMKQMKQKFPRAQISVNGLQFVIKGSQTKSNKDILTTSSNLLIPANLNNQKQKTDTNQFLASGINLLSLPINQILKENTQKYQPKDTKSIAERLSVLRKEDLQQISKQKNKSTVQIEQKNKNNQSNDILNFAKNNNIENNLKVEQYSLNKISNLYLTNSEQIPVQSKGEVPTLNLNSNQNKSNSQSTNTQPTSSNPQTVQSKLTPSVTFSQSNSQSLINQQVQTQQPYIPQQTIQKQLQQQLTAQNAIGNVYNGFSSATSQFGINYNVNQVQTQSNPSSNNGATIINQGDQNCQQTTPRGQCKKCSNRYYMGSSGFCVPVHPLCKDYNQRGDCTGCYKGYSVDNGKCAITLQNDPYCKQFIGSACSQCYNGYYFSQQARQCRQVNPLCRTSNATSGACLSCYPGYNLNKNTGNCQVYIKDPNCKQYKKDSPSVCQACAQRYYVNAHTGICASANPLCRDYDRNSGKCTICYPGYGLKDGQCVVGLAIDQYCKTFSSASDSACSQCFGGYYTNLDGKCKQANPLCRSFNPKNGYCTDCYYGYELAQQNGSCIVSISKDQNCRTFQSAVSNNCIQCYNGYLAINGKCQLQNPLCKTVNSSTGACLSCWQGYILDGINCTVSKTSSQLISDPYCVKIQYNQCIQCSNGYYYNKNNKKCQQIDLLCKTSDINYGYCKSCYQGYVLEDNKCKIAPHFQIPNCQTIAMSNNQFGKLICQQCVQGYYLQKQQCKLVSILCKGYDKNTGKCTGCIPGNFLQDGQCIYPAIFDEHCTRYESSYCAKCRDGFFVINFTCMPIDRHCHKFNYQDNICEQCVNGLSPKGYKCQ